MTQLPYDAMGPTPGAGGFAGRYVSLADMIAARGVKNITDWSNRDNDTAGEIDGTAIQAAIEAAENEVDEYLSIRYTMPLSWDNGGAPRAAYDMQRLRDISELIATFNLYKARGMSDDNDATKMRGDYDIAISRLASIRDAITSLSADEIESTDDIQSGLPFVAGCNTRTGRRYRGR